MTTWIHIDKLLALFGLKRDDLSQKSETELTEAVRNVARHIPTYVTIKDVKYRWGMDRKIFILLRRLKNYGVI